MITTDLMDDDETAITEPFSAQIESAKTMLATIETDEALLVTPNRSENPDNVKRIEAILDPKLTPETTDDPELWEFLFPRRNAAYTYEGFLQSAAKFPAFCGSDENNVSQITGDHHVRAFAQETGENSEFVETTNNIPKWRQALYFVRESGWLEGDKDGYNADCTAFPGNWKASAYPCGRISNEESPENEGEYKSYFGRGAKQLSYNFNYGPLSLAIYGDVETLLNDPAQVADTWLNFTPLRSIFIFYPNPKTLHAKRD